MVSYAMCYVGQASLWLCFVATLAAVATLVAGYVTLAKARAAGSSAVPVKSEKLTNFGYIAVFVATFSLVIAAFVIVEGFYTHNVAIQYVAQNYPTDTGSLFWLYQLAGLWASRAGSLLTWALLISVFAAWIAWHRRTQTDVLSNLALGVMMLVLLLFVVVMLFSTSNNPFVATNPSLIDANGNLTGGAVIWGMNVLLEHWAMVLHPPTLFVGYAGLTVPFAYGVAAFVCGDLSKRWVELCQRIAVFAFVFLTAGIGLGAVWAYVVLGWGGYWGWDPVENASLLSWLTAVAMLHSFTAYRKRGMLRAWSFVEACLSFCFVVLGTFITRSGIVESVHAFDKDPVSLFLFLAIIVLTLLALLVGYIVRRKQLADNDDIETVISKNGSYYLTNVIMTFSAILVAYLTVSSALPSWLPAGGMTIGANAYESVARPLGIIFCALAAVCPFLTWKKTDGAEFWKNVRIPAIVAAVFSVALVGHYACNLYQVYVDNLAQGGEAAADLASMGPAWYYNALAVLGLIVASLLMANSAYLIVRGVRTRMRTKSENAAVALARLFAKAPAQAGGYLTHLGLGIVLAGLVGSSMFVTDRTVSFYYEGESATVGAYTIVYEGDDYYMDDAKNRYYTVDLHAYAGQEDLGQMTPVIEQTAASYYGQSRVTAQVRTFPLEDLFVVFQGYDAAGGAVVNIRVNPLILLVWIGFAIMTLGTVCAVWPKRPASRQLESAVAAGGEPGADGDAAPSASAAEPAADAPAGSGERA